MHIFRRASSSLGLYTTVRNYLITSSKRFVCVQSKKLYTCEAAGEEANLRLVYIN